MSTYRLASKTVLRLGRAMVTGGESGLLGDAREVVAAASPAMQLIGAQHIPRTGPLVLLPNHWQRRGLWIGFPSALLTCAVADRRRSEDPTPVHWAVTGETRLLGGRLPVPGTRWAYGAVARCYGMVPLPVADDGRAARAGALRRLLALTLPPPRGQGRPTGFYLEGDEGRAGPLGVALPGAGAFVALLARAGVPLLPVGIIEIDDRLEVRIGAPFTLASDGRGVEGDRAAGDEVMGRIAALLPELATTRAR